MDVVMLDAKERAKSGKGYARRLRDKGLVPSVVYGKEIDSQTLEISAKEMEKLLSNFGDNALVKLKVGVTEFNTLIREVQRNPVRGDVVHVDFMQISMKDKLQTVAPIHLTGDAEGVKEGGILQHGLRELEVECLPTDIPEYIRADISELKIGDTLTVADLDVQENVEIISDPNSVVATIVAPRMEEEEDTEEAVDEVGVQGSPEEETEEA
ncbi:50S ribosomal protein L25/general stress protein Ctc [Metallumcola ferriviriculae]|uniref:Large ribosomal subunit protein bL25 n=1 Tax=Metallumcola ferriviriculae TaxID=3039180 RepID=A0AAU0UHH2_9FIRM|nr:50S ribosomal protein L25/general stress protein Ctc [Desulfitibacteraceae bacterium MK1]